MTNDHPARIRVALVDDQPLFREGFRAAVERTEEFELAGVAESAHDAVELVSSAPFELAVVDVMLPDLSGVSVTREVRRLQPRCRVLALSMVEEPYRVAEMMRAGASGYALKSQPTDQILAAMRVVVDGDRYLAPRLPRAHIEYVIAGGATTPIDQLSAREREVFDLVVRGCTNDRIAAQLFISTRTVETHRQHVMTKLAVHSTVELLRLAARHGLISD